MAALIVAIALEFGLPGQFVLSIALTENQALDPYAVRRNSNGTYDRGLMQLNSSWYKDRDWTNPTSNVRAACEHIVWIRNAGLSWWEVAVAYNGGYYALMRGKPPESALDYGYTVMLKWQELEPFNPENKGGN